MEKSVQNVPLAEPDAAKYIGVSVSMIQKLRYKRKIGFYRAGHRVLFQKEWLDAYIQQNAVMPDRPRDSK